ncbi:MAG TPA: hypothetical protein VFX59_06075 [Polyangiales bacterium]|nr:hypothetical protein [Polyangiales bacterium]
MAAKPKKVAITVKKSSDSSTEWLAAAQDGSGATARHAVPHHAIEHVHAQLRAKFGDDVEVEYELILPKELEKMRVDLHEKEDKLQTLLAEVPRDRYAFMVACMREQIRQIDMASLMKLSQSYLASLIRKGVNTAERPLLKRSRGSRSS